MKKQILFDNEARQKLLTGVKKLSKAVTTTLGPKGRNVALDLDWSTPKVIHDGVSVARDIELSDPFENMGAKLVKEASLKTNDATGDGTTTAVLLAEKITSLGMQLVTSGVNPMMMKIGMDLATDLVIAEIKKLAKPVKQADWEKVATLSAQNEKIGKIVAKALELVGENGLIEVEEGNSMDIEIEHREGMQFDKGFINTYFTTNENQTEAELNEAYILFTTEKIDLTNWADISPVIKEVLDLGKSFVLIADDISSEAVTIFVTNKLRGGFKLLPLKAPLFADRRKEILEDMAILTGGILFSKESGRTLKSAKIEDLGKADRVKSTKDYTRIIGGKGSKESLENRIKILKTFVENSKEEFEKERIKARIALLTGGVAVIRVGANSESEMYNLKERVIDAKGATQSAIESGIIPGGGITLINAGKVLDNLQNTDKEIEVGIKLIRDVLTEPLKLIAENAGKNGGYVVGKVIESNNPEYGFNVITGEFGNMIEQGIIEPAKIAIETIKNANSVAGMILTTDCLVTNEKEEDEK